MDLICYYCLVNDAREEAAVTMFDGATYCTRHAHEQARLSVQQAKDEEQARRDTAARLAELDPRRR